MSSVESGVSMPAVASVRVIVPASKAYCAGGLQRAGAERQVAAAQAVGTGDAQHAAVDASAAAVGTGTGKRMLTA